MCTPFLLLVVFRRRIKKGITHGRRLAKRPRRIISHCVRGSQNYTTVKTERLDILPALTLLPRVLNPHEPLVYMLDGGEKEKAIKPAP
jgi:hypothetical protein